MNTFFTEHLRTTASELLSYNFRKTKNWLNPYNDYDKVPQNLKNKVKGLHFSNTFLNELIYWSGGGIYGRAYSVSMKIN